MDWAAAQDHVRQWFAKVSRIDPALVSFAGEPDGMKPGVWAELAFRQLDAPEHSDEVRLTPIEGDETSLAAEQVGNRVVRLTCRVRSRDRSPHMSPFSYIERVRNRLELPLTQEAFEAAGLALRDVFPTASVPVHVDNREEAEAVLEMSFGYSISSLDEEAPETVPVLAGVRISGTAKSGSTTITVPEQQIPEPEETP